MALPWAIAACLARPDEKVVSMSGDGGFLFSAPWNWRPRCGEVQFHAPGLVRRFLDMVKIQQVLKYHRPFGVDFGPVDIVKYAEAFGAAGLRIQSADQIAPVLEQALNTPGPVLVEVPIDYRHNHDLRDRQRTRHFLKRDPRTADMSGKRSRRPFQRPSRETPTGLARTPPSGSSGWRRTVDGCSRPAIAETPTAQRLAPTRLVRMERTVDG